MKHSSSHLWNFRICPSFSMLFNSDFTLSSKCKRTRLLLVWIDLNGKWKCVITLFIDTFPNLLKKALKWFYMLKSVFEWTLDSNKSGIDTMFTGSSSCFCAISIPIWGKLSFPKIISFVSSGDIKKNYIFSDNNLFIFSWNRSKVPGFSCPQVDFLCANLSVSAHWAPSVSGILTGLAESTGIFIFTIASSPNPTFTNFFDSRPLSS